MIGNFYCLSYSLGGYVFVSHPMKMWFPVACILLFGATAVDCAEQETTAPYVNVETNYFANVGETFLVYVSLVPASQSKAKITMDPTWGTTFSRSTFVLGPGERKIIRAAIKKSVSGISWIHASSLSPGYADGWTAVVVDFDGRLKLSSTSALSYESANTLTVSLVDRVGKPLRLPGELELRLASADGRLSFENSRLGNTISLKLPAGSQTSPQFQIRSTSITGGSIHLAGTLMIAGEAQVLAQEDFLLNADPAWWLPVLLAVMGGLLHGCYKALRLEDDMRKRQLVSKSFGILVGSALAGLIGYFFAHLDLLGFKLDPNVLRSYPLIGFLFSYFGFEVLLPKRGSRQRGASDQDAPGAHPKG